MAAADQPPATPGPADPPSASAGPSYGWSGPAGTGLPPAPPPVPTSSFPPPPGGRAASRAPLVVALSVAFALILAGGAFAFLTVDPFHLFRAGPQAAEGLPASAVLYAGVDLDPTAEQKVDALRFLNHFPAFRESAGLTDTDTDVRKAVIEKALDASHCASVDYARDVAPWLGERFGFALMPPTSSQPHPFAIALQVRDEEAARRGVAVLQDCAAKGQQRALSTAAGVAFDNGYLLLSQTQADADAYAREAAQHSLADDPDFTADMGSLGDPGVATMWVDVPAAVSAFGGAGMAPGGVSDFTSTAQRVAATVRFGSDHVEIATSVFGDASSVAHDDNPVVRLPDSTVFAVSESGADQRLAQLWTGSVAKARAHDLDLDRQISDFENRTGLSLPGDLETILGHNIMVVIDKEGLTSDRLAGADPSGLDFGMRFTNDPAKLDALYDKMLGLVRSEADQSMPFVKLDAPDGMVVASNDGYAKKLGALDGTLGDSDAFRSVVDDGAGKEFVLFVNLEAVRDQVMRSMRAQGMSATVTENLQPLKAFGITEDVDGDYLHATCRLSVGD